MSTLPAPVAVTERGKPGLATSSLVLGIVGATFAFSAQTFLIALVCGIIAIVHGAKAKKFTARHGQAVAGLVLGIIAVSLGFVVLLAQSSSGY